ncbi:pyridoxamine 5'-phosphate oxidase family protein [Telmatospirillum sp.]|uniref:pyridoxamine 5'-phosphate oxidase family protein n=1 Tax=Telmatospirillum sp. TaxID=2079197 RepID=UPI002846F1B8|nr:pyridoxamine 5'-phosphate oxidase family protein [Telmatospirillum sp.]MDR3435663.1 pyridoxamine 5'-phosphate oxidase family protein [Telmatospirillum sp.]
MLQKTPRSTPRVKADRVVFDRDLANSILDEALICHVGFVGDHAPIVIPTIHWRLSDRLFFHGSRGGRLNGVMAAGQDLCVTVTLVDGLVLARSAFHHSMNYRSVVLFGQAVEVDDGTEKKRAFDALMEKMAPGRSPHVRPPNDKELAATRLLAMTIDEGSVKVRSGPPIDSPDDLSWPVWAGVLPLSLAIGHPIADDQMTVEISAGRPA